MISYDFGVTPQAVEVVLSSDTLPPNLAAVLDYWDRVRGDAFAPSLAQFKLVQLPVPCIPQAIIIDLHAPSEYDPARARFRYFGTLWVETTAQEMTGKTINQFKPDPVQKVLSDQYMGVLKTRRPRAFYNSLPTPKGLVCTFHMLRLPLSSDGARVDKVVSVCQFKENRRALQEVFETRLAAGTAG
jgi:hypothetical protein